MATNFAEQNSPGAFYWDSRQNVDDVFSDNRSVCDCTYVICIITIIWGVFVTVSIFNVQEKTSPNFQGAE